MEESENRMQLAKTVIKILHNSCMWPNKKWTILLYARMYVFFCIFKITDFGFAGYIHHYLDSRPFKFIDLSDDIAALAAMNAGFIAIHFHMRCQPKFVAILKELGDFTIYEKPLRIKELNRIINLMSEGAMVWVIFSITVVWAWYVAVTCEDGVEDNCGFPVPIYMPFDIFYVPMRQIITTLECYVAVHLAVICFFFPCVLLIISEYVVNRIKHLEFLLKQLPDMKREFRKSHLRKCIQYHQKIIQIWKFAYDSTYSFMFFWVPTTTLIMTLVLYQLTLEFRYSMFAHFFLWFVNINLICMAGERILSQSADLGFILYESVPWDGDLQTQNDLMIMMLRSSRELTIPAGLLGICSHVTLMNVFSASYKVLTLLYDVE